MSVSPSNGESWRSGSRTGQLYCNVTLILKWNTLGAHSQLCLGMVKMHGRAMFLAPPNHSSLCCKGSGGGNTYVAVMILCIVGRQRLSLLLCSVGSTTCWTWPIQQNRRVLQPPLNQCMQLWNSSARFKRLKQVVRRQYNASLLRVKCSLQTILFLINASVN